MIPLSLPWRKGQVRSFFFWRTFRYFSSFWCVADECRCSWSDLDDLLFVLSLYCVFLAHFLFYFEILVFPRCFEGFTSPQPPIAYVFHLCMSGSFFVCGFLPASFLSVSHLSITSNFLSDLHSDLCFFAWPRRFLASLHGLIVASMNWTEFYTNTSWPCSQHEASVKVQTCKQQTFMLICVLKNFEYLDLHVPKAGFGYFVF